MISLPPDIVTDCGTQFTLKFVTQLYNLCDVASNKSTAYQPQSHGQIERVNQVREQYLRIFCDCQVSTRFGINDLLLLAEFAFNNKYMASIIEVNPWQPSPTDIYPVHNLPPKIGLFSPFRDS
jgi:hypothetical protein